MTDGQTFMRIRRFIGKKSGRNYWWRSSIVCWYWLSFFALSWTNCIVIFCFSEMDTITSTSDTSGRFLVQTVSASHRLASALCPTTCWQISISLWLRAIMSLVSSKIITPRLWQVRSTPPGYNSMHEEPNSPVFCHVPISLIMNSKLDKQSLDHATQEFSMACPSW